MTEKKRHVQTQSSKVGVQPGFLSYLDGGLGLETPAVEERSKLSKALCVIWIDSVAVVGLSSPRHCDEEKKSRFPVWKQSSRLINQRTAGP